MIVLGIIIGLLIALVDISINFYLKETPITLLKEKLQSINKEKGDIIHLPNEEDEAISEIIQKNKELGQDTKMSDLNET